MKETGSARATRVTVTADALAVALADGRSVSVPIAWFPRLAQGTSKERENWRIIADGEGIHWPDLDEDISVEDLLAGRPSRETGESLKRWAQTRARKLAKGGR